MTARRPILAATLLGLAFLWQGYAQQSSKPPQKFEFLYEEGHGETYAEMVRRGRYDGYDSEKQLRYVDTVGEQTTYKAQLSEDERKAIYEAVIGLPAVKTDFMDTNVVFEPSSVGRLQLKIDGKVTEIRFDPNYGRVAAREPQRFPASARDDWARLRKALDIINGILKSKDEKQTLRQRNGYL
jgi:hypothetical protein